MAAVQSTPSPLTRAAALSRQTISIAEIFSDLCETYESPPNDVARLLLEDIELHKLGIHWTVSIDNRTHSGELNESIAYGFLLQLADSELDLSEIHYPMSLTRVRDSYTPPEGELVTASDACIAASGGEILGRQPVDIEFVSLSVSKRELEGRFRELGREIPSRWTEGDALLTDDELYQDSQRHWWSLSHAIHAANGIKPRVLHPSELKRRFPNCASVVDDYLDTIRGSFELDSLGESLLEQVVQILPWSELYMSDDEHGSQLQKFTERKALAEQKGTLPTSPEEWIGYLLANGAYVVDQWQMIFPDVIPAELSEVLEETHSVGDFLRDYTTNASRPLGYLARQALGQLEKPNGDSPDEALVTRASCREALVQRILESANDLLDDPPTDSREIEHKLIRTRTFYDRFPRAYHHEIDARIGRWLLRLEDHKPLLAMLCQEPVHEIEGNQIEQPKKPTSERSAERTSRQRDAFVGWLRTIRRDLRPENPAGLVAFLKSKGAVDQDSAIEGTPKCDDIYLEARQDRICWNFDGKNTAYKIRSLDRIFEYV